MRSVLPILAALLLTGCTAVLDESTFFPQVEEPAGARLRAPPGYTMTDALLDLPGQGSIHVVRLDNPASETSIIYSGGNSSFVAASSERAAALAAATGADLILYDYPGRGGTTVPPTIEAAIAVGPELVRQLRGRQWIGRGPLYAYGFSLGGSQAAAMSREGGFAGLILEGTAADIEKVGRNFVPMLAKPFVKIAVDPKLRRFDFLNYAIAARAPILLVSSEADKIVRPRNMRDFAEQLRVRGAEVSIVSVPGGHGSGLQQQASLAAIRKFVGELRGR